MLIRKLINNYLLLYPYTKIRCEMIKTIKNNITAIKPVLLDIITKSNNKNTN